jgi:hypothetical protein
MNLIKNVNGVESMYVIWNSSSNTKLGKYRYYLFRYKPELYKEFSPSNTVAKNEAPNTDTRHDIGI